MSGKCLWACLLGASLMLTSSCKGDGPLSQLMQSVVPKGPKQRARLPAPKVEAPAGSTIFKIDISGEQFAPPIEGLGTGAASIAVTPDQSAVMGALLLGDLSANSVGAHIHRGAPGENGNAVKTLNVVRNMAHFTWSKSDTSEPLTDELLQELVAGRLYVDIHTAENPHGEIRGQLTAQ